MYCIVTGDEAKSFMTIWRILCNVNITGKFYLFYREYYGGAA